jgi:anthranilate synthase component 2
MKILILDNYDSFTYNLVAMVRQLEVEVDVFRNDKISVEASRHYDGILLSPGPGIPSEAGLMPEIIKGCMGRLPILGVCLGHQAIAESFGCSLLHLDQVFHGIQSTIQIIDDQSILFTGIEKEFQAGRYHSWIAEPNETEDQLRVTAVDKTGQVMAFEHTNQKVFGVQFHPESIMTPYGHIMINNFLNFCKTFKV